MFTAILRRFHSVIIFLGILILRELTIQIPQLLLSMSAKATKTI